MSITREMVKAVATTHKFVGATEIKLPLSTADAVALSKLLEDKELQFAASVRNAVVDLDAIASVGSLDTATADEKVRYYAAYGKAATAFWDAFEGQDVDGVTVIRSR